MSRPGPPRIPRSKSLPKILRRSQDETSLSPAKKKSPSKSTKTSTKYISRIPSNDHRPSALKKETVLSESHEPASRQKVEREDDTRVLPSTSHYHSSCKIITLMRDSPGVVLCKNKKVIRPPKTASWFKKRKKKTSKSTKPTKSQTSQSSSVSSSLDESGIFSTPLPSRSLNLTKLSLKLIGRLKTSRSRISSKPAKNYSDKSADRIPSILLPRPGSGISSQALYASNTRFHREPLEDVVSQVAETVSSMSTLFSQDSSNLRHCFPQSGRRRHSSEGLEDDTWETQLEVVRPLAWRPVTARNLATNLESQPAPFLLHSSSSSFRLSEPSADLCQHPAKFYRL